MNLTLKSLSCFALLYCAFGYSQEPKKATIEYGDNFIVFEAEAANYSNLWKLRTPKDPEYQKYVTSKTQSGIPPINNTYLEYIGPWRGVGDSSKIEYKFKCPTSGDYQLAMRLLQPLEDGEKGDGKNDVFVKLQGNFESGTSKFKTEDLTHKHKFWGRGLNEWGTAQYLEHNGNAIPIYTLKEGEEYVLTMYGRSTGACIDYILFFHTDSKLGIKNLDLASQNPELYRPGGPAKLLDRVAKITFNKSATYFSQVGESKTLDYKIFPETAKDKTLIWHSSNEAVASVDQKGKVIGVSKGKATITTSTPNGLVSATNNMEVGKFIETFDSYRSDDLQPKTFTGDNGIEWTISAFGTIRMNDTYALQFSKGITGLKSASIPGGISNLSVQCKHLYLEDKERTLELLINGKVVGNLNKTTDEEYNFQIDNINIKGDFVLELRNATEGEKKSYSVMIDNLTWTPY